MSGDLRDAAVKQFLETLGEINRLLRDHAVQLRRSFGVTKVLTDLEVIAYRDGTLVEGYVEAELTSGDVVVWLLDIRWTEHSWTVDAALERKSRDRQESVRELPTGTAADFGGFINELKRVVRELLGLSISDAGIALG